MRAALRCFARLPGTSHTYRGLLQSPLTNYPARTTICKDVFARRAVSGKLCHRFASSGSRRSEKSRRLRQALRNDGLRVSNSRDPKSYIELYDEFLPVALRVGHGQNLAEISTNFDSKKVLTIYEYAQYTGHVDLWVWMAQNGYRKQLVWLLNESLKDMAAWNKVSNQSTPSNVDWPTTLFDDLHYGGKKHIQITRFMLQPRQPTLDEATANGAKTSPLTREFMTAVWMTLAKLVLAVDNPDSDTSQSCMNTVLLVLATLHNLNMIPADVYTYNPLNLSSSINRPPILHLVYSRILTSLSDATWRDQQDDAIAQASKLGHSLKHISENVPGGRFRLKVQPLPIEIWLELILWCCVDGGLPLTAHDIITLIHRLEDPWFSVRWCSTHTSPLAETLVDWNRVKLRHGGTVGLIEGYSREKPFVDVPQKTVSVEVVLALIEAFATGESSRKLTKIADLIRFLEPHDLPPSYFDFLESRLISAGFLDSLADPSRVEEWSKETGFLRTLKPMNDVPRITQTLELDSVLDHSQLHLGVMHQCLDALVNFSAVHNALELFNDIQEEVDRNKIKSITEFLQAPLELDTSASSANQDQPYRLEYADSHGQIPYYRLASFLDLSTEAKMLGLGEWLLYSEDPDDALIPSSAYTVTSLAPSISRYAAATRDATLLARVVGQFDATKDGRPSVRACRAFFDAGVESLDFRNVARWMFELKNRSARIGLSNYAYLGAVILRIEKSIVSDRPNTNNRSNPTWLSMLGEATRLLERLLSDYYRGPGGSDTLVQRKQYHQQVSHILRLYAQCRGSKLQDIARKYSPRYASGNNVMLPTRVFNVLLNGIVDAYGASRGREMYDIFCKEPTSGYPTFLFDPDQFESDFQEMDVTIRKPSTLQDEHDFELAGGRHQPEQHIPEDSKQQAITTSTYTPDPSVDFSNAFFPIDESNQQIDARATTEDTFMDSIISSDRFLRPLPITFPQASTLRVIVQGALAHDDANSIESLSVTDWAISQFLLIGTKNVNIIAEEIQRPLTKVDIQGMKTKLRYQLSRDQHPLANDDLGLYQARLKASERQYEKGHKGSELKSLWADTIPSWQN